MGARWTRARTLGRLRERAAKRDDLRAPRVKHDEPELHAAAVAFFGTFAAAARAAGVSPSPRRKLSRAAIIADLRELQRRGVRMTATAIVDAGRNDLMSAVFSYFGGLTSARVAAGILAPPRPKREIRWGRDAVIAAIKRAYRRDEPLSHSRVDRDLFRGACNSFRTWRAAVEAAGIRYERVRLQQHHYTDEELLEILRDIHRSHPEMTLSELHLLPPHGNILRQRFGDLRAIARRIGIGNWPHRAQPIPPSAAVTLRRLRARAASGRSYGPKSLAVQAPRIYLGAIHHFGGVAAAVKAAGIEPIRLARRKALIDEVFRTIRGRAALGQSLRRIDVLRDAPKLADRAGFYFGSWDRTVKLALARRPIRARDLGGGFALRQRNRVARHSQRDGPSGRGARA